MLLLTVILKLELPNLIANDDPNETTETLNSTIPAVLQSPRDYHLRTSGFKIPGFTVSDLKFPFVDSLGDGYTPIAYASDVLMTATNLLAGFGLLANPCVFSESSCETSAFEAFPAFRPSTRPIISHNFTNSSTSPYPLTV